MIRVMKYLSLVVLVCMAALTGHARTFNIAITDTRSDLTQQLREECGRINRNDTVVINFGEGEYTVSGTIRIQCHAVIKGKGSGKTTIWLDKGSDKGGFKSFIDDTYFRITGTAKNPISVSISDVTLRLKEHKGLWWEDEIRHAVKIYHANFVDIHDTESYMENAVITNFDLRVCSNVTIANNIISNYNNCNDGGGLWIRGEMHNINVKGNKFYKYGKDETLGIYDRVVDVTNGYVRGTARRTDIFVEDNELYYGGYNGKDKDPEANCGMLFTLMTDHKLSKDQCTTRNFHLRNNKFFINDVTTRCMYIGFDPADYHKDIYIENNQIINGDIGREYRYYHKDIEVHDLSSCGDTIHINGNTVINRNLVLTDHDDSGYMFLQTRGGIVSVLGNHLLNEVTVNPKNRKPYGMRLIWCQYEGGNVTLRDNVCKGLESVAYVGGGEGTDLFTLNASNNVFEGDTRIYSHKIKKMNLNFKGNTFRSSNMNFFLVEFAPSGSVVFDNNDVTVNGGNGQFMTHWSKSSTKNYRFDRLEVKYNVFHGVANEKELLKNVTNARKRKIGHNRYNR